MSEIKWTDAQALAIQHEGSDLIISAAAGSGKSATLTERIIRKIKSGKDISKMLVVTFTKAATAELKNKISNALSDALLESPSSKHIQEQIVKVGSADICTIDSFCMKLVRPNFDKLSLNADFRIGDSAEIDILERETMAEVIDELYESKTTSNSFLLVVDCYSSIWSEAELGKSLLSLRSKLLSTAKGLKTLLDDHSYDGEFFESSYGSVLKRNITEALEYFLPIYQDAVRDIKSDEKGDKYIDIFSSELDFCQRLQRAFDGKKSYDEIKAIVSSLDFPTISRANLSNFAIPLTFYKNTRTKLKDFTTTLQEDFFKSTEAGIKSSIKQNQVICKAIYDILSKFEEALLKKKSAYSIYSFNDISNFALSLLYDNGEVSDLAKSIASQYEEIYIDEYQDTNSVQDKIFKAISKNNRFMVGDIKQSIYRFRSAEPEIFSYYRSEFDKVENFNESSSGLSIFMSDNFRCDKKIIDFSNLVSNYMFYNSYGIPYEISDQLNCCKNHPDSLVPSDTQICLLDTKGLGRGNGPKYQAEYVAKRIKEMIDNERLPNGEKIRASDIAILLRNYKSNHKLYIEALEKYGVSARYEIAEGFYEKPHIQLFICILNAIDNPSRDIYLAGAMRSDVFGFSLDELVKIRKRAEKSASLYSSLLSYSEEGVLKDKIESFLNKLKDLKSTIRKMSSYESISYIYGALGILSMCNSEQKGDLIKLYNIAREYESSSFKGLYSFLKHIERISDSKGEKSFRGDVSKDNVKIMTIHSSKGLEFEVCFLCDLEDNFNHSDTGEPILFQRQLGIAGYVSKDDGLSKFKTMARKCIALQIERDMREEEMRVLYVAMTRARSKLILVGATGEPQKKLAVLSEGKKYVRSFALYHASSLLSFVLGAICEPHSSFEINYVDASPSTTNNEKGCASFDRSVVDKYKSILENRIGFEYQYDHLKKLPSKLSVSKLYPEILDGNENEGIELKPLSDMPRFLNQSTGDAPANERGTATHLFLQFCDFKALGKEGIGIDAEIKRLYDSSFISKRDSELIEPNYIKNFACSKLYEEIMNAKWVLREFRFNVMIDASELSRDDKLSNEKVLVQGVTDCIYENSKGELILVDYKTDNVNEQNYDYVLRSRYSNQIDYYKKACRLMFNRDVSKAIIYAVAIDKEISL